MTEKYFVPPILFCFNAAQLVLDVAYSNIIVPNRCSNDSLKQTTKTLLAMSIRATMLSIPQVQKLRGREVRLLHCY
jgi:hypothetical protein